MSALVLSVALATSATVAEPLPALPQDVLQDEGRLWRPEWPRFRAEEYGFTAGALTGLTLTTLLVPRPPQGFKGPFLIDDPIRDLIRLEGRDVQNRWSQVSDVMQNAALLVPIVVDIGLGTLLLHEDWDAALQVALMDLEAFVLAATFVTVTKRTIGRVRPNIEICADGTFACHSNASRRAFVSGHANASFAAAGLTCVHHQYLELFGGGLADDLMCAGMLGLATGAAVLRVASDKHWATDVIAGGLTGLFSGYAVPYLLHYQGEGDWPGLGDGELDGEVALYALGGLTSAAGGTGATAGTELSLRARTGLGGGWRLEGEGRGRLLYDHRGVGVRELWPEARLWWGEAAVGVTGVYRAHALPGGDVVQGAFGPSLTFGTHDEARPITASLAWLPGGGGDPRLVVARLVGAVHRHVALSLEGTPLFATDEGRGVRGAAVTVGLGGRLPW